MVYIILAAYLIPIYGFLLPTLEREAVISVTPEALVIPGLPGRTGGEYHMISRAKVQSVI